MYGDTVDHHVPFVVGWSSLHIKQHAFNSSYWRLLEWNTNGTFVQLGCCSLFSLTKKVSPKFFHYPNMVKSNHLEQLLKIGSYYGKDVRNGSQPDFMNMEVCK